MLIGTHTAHPLEAQYSCNRVTASWNVSGAVAGPAPLLPSWHLGAEMAVVDSVLAAAVVATTVRDLLPEKTWALHLKGHLTCHGITRSRSFAVQAHSLRNGVHTW